jgi:hypothetical protein
LIQLKYASENNNLNISFHVGRQKYGWILGLEK